MQSLLISITPSGFLLLIFIAVSAISPCGFSASLPVDTPPSVSEELNDLKYNWPVWLEEGNYDVVEEELKKISGCLNLEKEAPEEFVTEGQISECQKSARSIINYRDEAGRNLLHLYMMHSQLRLKHDGMIVLLLRHIGVDLFQINNEISNNILFLAIKYNNLDLFIFLMELVKDDFKGIIPLLPEMRSSQGVSLANALFEQYPDEIRTAAIISQYKPAPDLGKITKRSGIAYTIVKYTHKEL